MATVAAGRSSADLNPVTFDLIFFPTPPSDRSLSDGVNDINQWLTDYHQLAHIASHQIVISERTWSIIYFHRSRRSASKNTLLYKFQDNLASVSSNMQLFINKWNLGLTQMGVSTASCRNKKYNLNGKSRTNMKRRGRKKRENKQRTGTTGRK